MQEASLAEHASRRILCIASMSGKAYPAESSAMLIFPMRTPNLLAMLPKIFSDHAPGLTSRVDFHSPSETLTLGMIHWTHAKRIVAKF